MKHTVIALFDEAEGALKAADALKASGFDASAVHVTQGSESGDTDVIPPATQIESGPLTGLLHRLAVLFSAEETHLPHYKEAVRRGGSLVQADAADEAQAASARDTLLAMGAVNIDDRVAQWEQAGWRSAEAAGSTSVAGGPSGLVHRQEASIGGVRVYGHAVVVAFDDLAEEFRADYETRQAGQGTTYADFDPAYRYGHALASDTRYEGRSWDEIEPQARAEWEGRHPQSAWDRFKSAVRHAWEHATRR